MFLGESWKPVYLEVRRSEVKVTSTKDLARESVVERTRSVLVQRLTCVCVCVSVLCVGQASSPRAECAGVAAELLADIGWQLASSSTAVVTSRPPCDVTGSRCVALSVCGLSSRAQDLHRRVKTFIEQCVLPVEQDVMDWYREPPTKWTIHPRIEQLKVTLCYYDYCNTA